MNWREALRSLRFWEARTPEESRQLSNPRIHLYKIVVFWSFILLFAAMFMPAFWAEFQRWKSARPRTPVPLSEWRVHFSNEPAIADPLSIVVPDRCMVPGHEGQCPANPARPELWSSPIRRGAPGGGFQISRDFERQVRAHDGKVLWIGAPISLKDRRPEERFILLGFINTPFAVYIDGEMIQAGNTLSHWLAVSVPIPEKFLRRDTIHVAVAMDIHISKSTFPFQMNIRFGGEGLVSAKGADWNKMLLIFVDFALPLSLVLAQLMMAIAFFYFWATAKRKQEYFYLSLFSLIHTLIQTSLINFVFQGWGFAKTYYFDCVLRVWEGAFAFAFAISFARGRIGVFKLALPVVVLLPFAAKLLPGMNQPRNLQMLNHFFAIYWVVPLYLAGAAALCYQYILLHKSKPRDLDALKRKSRLRDFMVGFSIIGLIYAIHALRVASFGNYLWFHRVAHLGVFLFVAYIVVSEYRETNEIMERVFINRYLKQLSGLCSTYQGVLLRFDLKKSKRIAEEYLKKSGEHGNYHTTTNLWANRAVAIALESGGVLLDEPQGDEALIFFDTTKHPEPLDQAIEAIARIVRFSHELFEQSLGMEFDTPIRLRDSICGGELVYQKTPSGKVEKSGQVLVTSKQDLERETNLLPGTRSRLILDEAAFSYTNRNRAKALQIRLKQKPLTDKAGTTKMVWVVEYPDQTHNTFLAA